MSYIIGQESLCQIIDSYQLEDLPQVILLIGPRGSGKDLMIDYISNHLNLEVYPLTDTSFETLNELYLRVNPIIYLLENLSIKSQNQILKFLEEPPKNCLIIIKALKLGQYLPTIENRCRMWWHLHKYSKQDLQQFTNNNLIIEVAETPGQVLEYENSNFNSVYELAQKVIDKISVASYGNLFNILDKIKSKELNISIDLFIKLLLFIIQKNLKSQLDIHSWYDIYILTKNLYADLDIPHINKDQLVENYLITLKEYHANQRT